MTLLEIVNLTALMQVTSGNSQVVIGLIDGPVAINHPDLASQNIREVPGKMRGVCTQANSVACTHGTCVAGILAAKRGSFAPAICPQCTLLVRPIFAEAGSTNDLMLSATPQELATGIIEVIDAGARVINLSAAWVQPSAAGQRELEETLDYAARRGVIIVAAAGNQATVGSTCITRHPWVIPVTACNLQGQPLAYSNMGNSIGRRGLGAPGENIPSLGTDGKSRTFDGTSAATPFVTGAIALLLSEFPNATPAEVKLAVSQTPLRRKTIVPPLLNAWTAYQIMSANHERR